MLLVPLAASAVGAATEPVVLEADDFHADLTRHVRALEDPARRSTLVEALAAPTERWQPIRTNVIDFGFSPSRFWLRVPVVSGADRRMTWKVSPEMAVAESMSVFLVRDGASAGDGEVEAETVLDAALVDAFDLRPVAHRFLVADITLDPGERAEVVIAYASDRATQMPLFIEDPATFAARVHGEAVATFAFFGLLAGMALVTTLYIASLGLPAAWNYGAYIGLSILYVAHADGHTFQYLWPDAPGWNVIALVPLGMATGVASLLFTRAFLTPNGEHPQLARWLAGATVPLALAAAGSFPFFEEPWFKTATAIAVALTTPLVFVSAVVALRAGTPGGRFFAGGVATVGATVVLLVIGYLVPGLYDQDDVGVLAAGALLVESVLFALAIFVQAIRVRGERSRALRAELALGREKLALSEALRSAEAETEGALATAARSRERLATTAHDIGQPLASLRASLIRLNRDDATRRQLEESFDYLARIVSQSLSAPAGGAASIPTEHDDEPERFEANVVLGNVAAMFANEAKAAGTRLRVVGCDVPVEARPLELMRIVSNLVANAVRHAGGERVVLGCRRRGPRLVFEVHDDGRGLAPERLGTLVRAGAKGAGSRGSGLGLAIVDELVRGNGFALDMRSRPGGGTSFHVAVPRAACE